MFNNPKIVISLDDSTYAHKFDQKSLIHNDEFQQICYLVDQQIAKIEAGGSRGNRMHNAIAIFGDRGTGKTSFLDSVLDYYCTQQTTGKGKNLTLLGVIDPTLLEEKAHIFLLIISLIDEQVNTYLNNQECTPNSEMVYTRKRWRQKLLNLAKGLPSLDQIGKDYQNDSWQSAEFIMEKGLKEMDAAYHLHQNFHDLVKQALDILHKKAFVIAFDDIDINFDKGWRVLETIRKYLTVDQFIILLCGNLKLYNLNVWQQQWKQLIVRSEPINKNLEEYSDMVYQLENHYMMKVFKSHNRVHLVSLLYAMRWNQTVYMVKGNHRTLETLITVAYKEVLNHLGIKGLQLMKHFTNYLLGLSIRSQINFLKSNWDMDSKDKDLFQIKRIEIFISWMYAQNIDVNRMLNHPSQITISILKYLLSTKDMRDLYQLVPTSDQEQTNACLVGLTMLYAWNVQKNPFLIFDYFLRIGYIRNLIQSESNASKINLLIDYASLKEDVSLKNIIGLCMAYQQHLNPYYSMQEHVFLTHRITKELYIRFRNSYRQLDKEVQDKLRNLLQDVYDLHYKKLVSERSSLWDNIITKLINPASRYSDLEGSLNPTYLKSLKTYTELIPEEWGSNVKEKKCFSALLKLLEAMKETAFSSPLRTKPEQEPQQVLLRLPLCVLRNGGRSAGRRYYSVFILLGCIGQILKTLTDASQATATDADITKTDTRSKEKGLRLIKHLLIDLQLLRNYLEPNSTSIRDIAITLEQEDEETGNISVDTLSTLTDAIWEWWNQYPCIHIPPYLLGRMATRFFFMVQRIHEEYLGDQMHQSIVMFLNTCLTLEQEEASLSDEEGKEHRFELFNTSVSYITFSDKLKALDENAFKKIPLTGWLLQCPLLYAYLKSELIDEIRDTVGKGMSDSAKKKSNDVFNKINQLAVYKILNGNEG